MTAYLAYVLACLNIWFYKVNTTFYQGNPCLYFCNWHIIPLFLQVGTYLAPGQQYLVDQGINCLSDSMQTALVFFGNWLLGSLYFFVAMLQTSWVSNTPINSTCASILKRCTITNIQTITLYLLKKIAPEGATFVIFIKY